MDEAGPVVSRPENLRRSRGEATPGGGKECTRGCARLVPGALANERSVVKKDGMLLISGVAVACVCVLIGAFVAYKTNWVVGTLVAGLMAGYAIRHLKR